MKDAATLLLMLSAVGAFLAAIGSLLSANATRRAVEAQLVSAFLKEYGSEDIKVALRTLINWKETHGQGFQAKWIEDLRNGDAEAQKVDNARRLVKFHFWNALRLYEARYVRKRFLREVTHVSGIDVLFDIVEALDRKLGCNQEDDHKYQRLHELCSRYWRWGLRQPVPVHETAEGSRHGNAT